MLRKRISPLSGFGGCGGGFGFRFLGSGLKGFRGFKCQGFRDSMSRVLNPELNRLILNLGFRASRLFRVYRASEQPSITVGFPLISPEPEALSPMLDLPGRVP